MWVLRVEDRVEKFRDLRSDFRGADAGGHRNILAAGCGGGLAKWTGEMGRGGVRGVEWKAKVGRGGPEPQVRG